MLVSLFVGSLAGGYVRDQTRSLLPGIMAHALGNLPFRGWVEPAVLAVMAVLVAIWWRTLSEHAVRFWHYVMIREAVTAVGPALLVLTAVLAQVIMAPALLPASAAIALTAALLLEFWEKRS